MSSEGRLIAVPKELIERIMRAFPDPAVTKADMLTPANDPDTIVRDTFDRNILPLYGRKGGNPFFDKQGHVAEPGDTWKSIAAKYGVSVDDLVIANPHIPPLTLSPGNFVLVPKKYGFNEFVEGIIHPDTNMNLQYDGDASAPEAAEAASIPGPDATAAAAAPVATSTDAGFFHSSLNDFWRKVRGAPAPQGPAGPLPAPQGRLGNALGWLRQQIGSVTPAQVVTAAALAGGAVMGGSPAIGSTLYGAYQLARGNNRAAVAAAIPGIAAGVTTLGERFFPSYVPPNASTDVFNALSSPAGRIATNAGVNALNTFANAKGGFGNRLGAAGLSLGASIVPGAAVAIADSGTAMAAVQDVLNRFGLSSLVDPQSVLQAVKMFGPGFLRSFFPPNVDPKVADSAIGQIVDSLYNSHLWSQYLQAPSAKRGKGAREKSSKAAGSRDRPWAPPFTVPVIPPGPVTPPGPSPQFALPGGDPYESFHGLAIPGAGYGPQSALPGADPYESFHGLAIPGAGYGPQSALPGADPYLQLAAAPPPYTGSTAMVDTTKYGSTALVDPSAMGAYTPDYGFYNRGTQYDWGAARPRPNATSATLNGWSVPVF